MRAERVIAYIDGFNLYHGLCDAQLESSRWLDLHGVCQSLLKPHQHLVLVRYFTSMVRNKPRAAKRQSVYVDALRSRGGIEIDFGHRLSKTLTCSRCGFAHSTSVEKKTDVNIAVRLLEDAYDDRFDVALVISADSDLAPPIEAVRRRSAGKTLLAAAPPARWSSELKRVAQQHPADAPGAGMAGHVVLRGSQTGEDELAGLGTVIAFAARPISQLRRVLPFIQQPRDRTLQHLCEI